MDEATQWYNACIQIAKVPDIFFYVGTRLLTSHVTRDMQLD